MAFDQTSPSVAIAVQILELGDALMHASQFIGVSTRIVRGEIRHLRALLIPDCSETDLLCFDPSDPGIEEICLLAEQFDEIIEPLNS